MSQCQSRPTYFLKKIYVFTWKAESQRVKGKERQKRELFHALLHFSNDRKRQSRAGPTSSFSRVSYAGAPGRGSSSSAFPGPLPRSWSARGTARTQTSTCRKCQSLRFPATPQHWPPRCALPAITEAANRTVGKASCSFGNFSMGAWVVWITVHPTPPFLAVTAKTCPEIRVEQPQASHAADSWPQCQALWEVSLFLLTGLQRTDVITHPVAEKKKWVAFAKSNESNQTLELKKQSKDLAPYPQFQNSKFCENPVFHNSFGGNFNWKQNLSWTDKGTCTVYPL